MKNGNLSKPQRKSGKTKLFHLLPRVYIHFLHNVYTDKDFKINIFGKKENLADIFSERLATGTGKREVGLRSDLEFVSIGLR